jgi:hypothetical protein
LRIKLWIWGALIELEIISWLYALVKITFISGFAFTASAMIS